MPKGQQAATKPNRDKRVSSSKEITEPNQTFKTAQPYLTTIITSSGMEPDHTAEEPDVPLRKDFEGKTEYEPETKQPQKQEKDPKLDQLQKKEFNQYQKEESHQRQVQKSDEAQEQESDQRQEKEVESEQEQEENSEPQGYSDSDLNTQLLPKQDGNNSEDHNTDKDRDKKKFKIFVIGKTGTGKSSLCNKIIGRNAFVAGRSFKQITTETQKETTTLSGLNITLVDTPDISEKGKAIQEDTVKRWRDSAQDYNYMVVMAVRCDVRYSPAEYEVYRQIKQLWGNDLVQKLVVAFTFGDTREDPGLDMKKELEEVWAELKHVIKDANNRYVVFNNEDANKDKAPVTQLVEYFKLLQAAEQEQEQEQECNPPCSTKAVDICPEAKKISRKLSRSFKILIGATVCLIAGTFGYLVFYVSDPDNFIRALMSKMAW